MVDARRLRHVDRVELKPGGLEEIRGVLQASSNSIVNGEPYGPFSREWNIQ